MTAMKAPVAALAAASALVVAPMLTGSASATSVHRGAWTFTDYTPDPVALAAAQMLYVSTGRVVTSYCQDSRVPSAPQDVNAHRFRLSAPAVLRLQVTPTGAWGVEVDTPAGGTLAGVATGRAATDPVDLRVRLRPGAYVVAACNLGGGPDAHADYRLTPIR
jgi:hypothetical protein